MLRIILGQWLAGVGPCPPVWQAGSGSVGHGVDLLVVVQGLPVAEALAAAVALEGPLLGVPALVLLQQRLHGEALRALDAAVEPLPGCAGTRPSRPAAPQLHPMDALVFLEVVLLDEALAAGRAAVGPLPGVDALVDDEVVLEAEGLAALGADEGALPGVVLLVPGEAGLLAEALPAQDALELLPRRLLLLFFQAQRCEYILNLWGQIPYKSMGSNPIQIYGVKTHLNI